jgi:DNA-binding CsgD family transcriptional regulator
MVEPRPKKTLDDKAILSLYQTVLPYLYSNPENLDIPNEIGQWLSDFIEYDYYHTTYDDSNDKEGRRRVKLNFTLQSKKKDADVIPLVTFQTSGSPDSSSFETAAKVSYDGAMARAKKRYPNIKEYHYLRLQSYEDPQIVVGFFRRGPGHPFTEQERELFKRLEPHLLLVYRCAFNQHAQSQAFHYFDGFAKLASRLAQEHKLSDAEVRLIPDLLFGYSNEEIAERQFVSVPTVKSHIQHILKKTETKSRLDLIGKFFTSPEHVRL